MIGFFNRLDGFFKSRGLAPTKVEAECGLGNGSVGKALKRGSMTTDVLFKIIDYYKINIHWLYTGLGPEELAPVSLEIEKLSPMDIVNHIQDNLDKFLELKRFQVLVEGVSKTKENQEMKEMFKKMQSQIESLNKDTGIK